MTVKKNSFALKATLQTTRCIGCTMPEAPCYKHNSIDLSCHNYENYYNNNYSTTNNHNYSTSSNNTTTSNSESSIITW
eukprot:790903-Amphidinium_carterae.1